MPEGLDGHAWAFDVAPAMAGIEADDDARGVALAVVASIVLGQVINSWPVDTALSIAGFRRARSGKTWLVYNDVDYAPYVHDGLADRLASQAVESAKSAARESVRKTTAERGEGLSGVERRRALLRERQARRRRASRVGRAASASAATEAATFRSAVQIVQPLRLALGAAEFNSLVSVIRLRQWDRARRTLLAIGARREAAELERLVRGN